MSRKHRDWFPGAMYHITARGNRRSALFEGREDYLMYLTILEDVRSQSPFFLHSYCLMTNHIHLQIETTTFHISEVMKKIHGRYAIWFNKEHDYIGHLFQERYGSKLITDPSYFLGISRYIHLNPIEAKMVHNPQDYPWSSYCAYLALQKDPHVTTKRILSYFPGPKSTHYQQFVERKDEFNRLEGLNVFSKSK